MGLQDEEKIHYVKIYISKSCVFPPKRGLHSTKTCHLKTQYMVSTIILSVQMKIYYFLWIPPGLAVINSLSISSVLILEKHPIRTLYQINTALLLDDFNTALLLDDLSTSMKIVLQSLMTDSQMSPYCFSVHM